MFALPIWSLPYSFRTFQQLYLMLHLLFVAKSVTFILLTNSQRVFRSSGCSSIVVWSSTATSQINCWQMESTWIMMVVKSSVLQGHVASSSAYTVPQWITGRNSRLAKRIYYSPTQSLLQGSSCCI